MNKEFDISVVIPVVERVTNLSELYREYRQSLAKFCDDYEFIFVLDGGAQQYFDELKALAATDDNVKVLRFAKYFGESTALSAGIEKAGKRLILTLPAYYQIEPDSIGDMIAAMDNADMVVARRWPRAGSGFDRFRRWAFHFLLRALSGEKFRDLGCGARLFRRDIAAEVHLYGDQHRFLPVLVNRLGYVVKEIDVQQSTKDVFAGRYRVREYLHRTLDIVIVFFLVRFTKKPLRFFGMIGSIVSAVGGLVVLTVVIQRLFYDIALSDRPALFLGSLLLVLGVQVFAMGLVGELIIFTHADRMKEYTVEEVVN